MVPVTPECERAVSTLHVRMVALRGFSPVEGIVGSSDAARLQTLMPPKIYPKSADVRARVGT